MIQNNKVVRKLFVFGVSAVALIEVLTALSCSSPELRDGYQFGDGSVAAMRGYRRMVEARNKYCLDTKDSHLKAIAITAIRAYEPLYPVEGICTDMFYRLMNGPTTESETEPEEH